jgi:hypothetical protein
LLHLSRENTRFRSHSQGFSHRRPLGRSVQRRAT